VRALSQPLTDRNGIVCWECFKTIDLTSTKTKDAYRRVGFLRRLVTAPDRFVVTCPFCGATRTYSYFRVHPIAPSWAEEKDKLETRIKSLELENTKVKAEAKLIAKAYHNSNPSQEDAESAPSTPTDSTQKPPTPPEGPALPKKKEGPYF